MKRKTTKKTAKRGRPKGLATKSFTPEVEKVLGIITNNAAANAGTRARFGLEYNPRLARMLLCIFQYRQHEAQGWKTLPQYDRFTKLGFQSFLIEHAKEEKASCELHFKDACLAAARSGDQEFFRQAAEITRMNVSGDVASIEGTLVYKAHVQAEKTSNTLFKRQPTSKEVHQILSMCGPQNVFISLKRVNQLIRRLMLPVSS